MFLDLDPYKNWDHFDPKSPSFVMCLEDYYYHFMLSPHAPPDFRRKIPSDEWVNGMVTTELRFQADGKLQGQVSYVSYGQTFFLPYEKEDIEGSLILRPEDVITFQVVSKQPSGILMASKIRVEKTASGGPPRYMGVVKSLKYNYGFIETADGGSNKNKTKELFFHYSEIKSPEGVSVGDYVEFSLRVKFAGKHEGKELAYDVITLPYGTFGFPSTTAMPDMDLAQRLQGMEL